MIDSDRSARLGLDVSNIDESEYPEIFNVIEQDESEKNPDESADETQTPTLDASQIDFPDEIEGKTEKIKYLSEISGMKNNEIADLLNESEQNVSYHLSK